MFPHLCVPMVSSPGAAGSRNHQTRWPHWISWLCRASYLEWQRLVRWAFFVLHSSSHSRCQSPGWWCDFHIFSATLNTTSKQTKNCQLTVFKILIISISQWRRQYLNVMVALTETKHKRDNMGTYARTMRLSAACVRSDTAAPSIHTKRSPLRTPAFSAAPPLVRFTENRPFSPARHKVGAISTYRPSFGTLDRWLPMMLLPSTGVKLMPRPETGSLVMWQSLGGLQSLPLRILISPRGFCPWDTAFSYTPPSTTNKPNWFPLSFIFRATWKK